MADRSADENASPGNVRERTPGTWVSEARERHEAIIDARVNAARRGERPGTFEGYENADVIYDSDTGSISDLLDLVDLLDSGSLDSLTDLLGSTDTQDNDGSTSGSSGYTIEDLLRLRDEMLGDSSSTSKESSRAQSYETRSDSGAIGRLPKIESRAQDNSTTERKFVARWAETMAETIFTALAVGFRSDAFIDFLKDALQPVFFPVAGSDDDDSGSAGGGIENLNPTSGSGGGSGSIV